MSDAIPQAILLGQVLDELDYVSGGRVIGEHETINSKAVRASSHDTHRLVTRLKVQHIKKHTGLPNLPV